MRSNYIVNVVDRKGKCQLELKGYDENGKRKTLKSKMTDVPIKSKQSALITNMKQELIDEYKNKAAEAKQAAERKTVARERKSELTFVEYLNKWLKWQENNVADVTYEGYRSVVRNICEYFPPDLLLSEVTFEHINDFYDYRLDEGNCVNTVRHYHANIHKALKDAVERRLIEYNPADIAHPPRKANSDDGFEYNTCSVEELQELFKYFKGDPLELCVYIAAHYGLRRSEVIGLKWDAVDFKNNILYIKSKTIQIWGKGIKDSKTLKTKSSKRNFPLFPNIKEMLIREKAMQEHYRKECRACYDTSGDGYVFRFPTGERIKPNYVTEHFRLMIEKSGFKKLRFHDLRHSCASIMYRSNLKDIQIQKWLGHSDVRTTIGIYCHICDEDMAEAANVVEQVFSAGSKSPANNTQSDSDSV